VVARFGPVAGLHVRLHDAERPVDTIARLAPDVIAAAEAGDAVATGIAEEAVRELVALVRTGVALALPDHASGRRAPVALGGRLVTGDGPLRARLDAGLAGAGLDADVRTADGSALDGALLLGTAREHRYGSLVHRWRGGTA
jgi:N-acetylglucosamine kinase-like BadF-type ATPase